MHTDFSLPRGCFQLRKITERALIHSSYRRSQLLLGLENAQRDWQLEQGSASGICVLVGIFISTSTAGFDEVFSSLNNSISNDHCAVAGFYICFYHRSKLWINTLSENQVLINAVSPHYTNSSITGPVTPCRNTGLKQQGSLQLGGTAIPQVAPPLPHSPKHFLQEFLHVSHRPPAC